MNAWKWFQTRGDDVLSFLTMVGVTAQVQQGLLDPVAMRWVTFALSVAAIAHKVFFPTSAQPGAGVSSK